MTKTKKKATPAMLAGLEKARAARAAKKAPAPETKQEPDVFFIDLARGGKPIVTVEKKDLVFFTSGDLGDIIAMLPSVRHMGGGSIVIGEREHTGTGQGFCRESMKGARYEAIKPLLEAQPYVTGVSWGDLSPDMVDVSSFRIPPYRLENIAQCIARYLKLGKVSEEPWLTVPDPIPGPVVFARSARYHNLRFPWPGYCDKYPNARFCGLPGEHQAFEAYVGRPIEYLPTADLLELARVIAGAERVITNQTCIFWIAAGLNRPLVQETCPDINIQNSFIERDHFHYTGNVDQVTRPNWH